MSNRAIACKPVTTPDPHIRAIENLPFVKTPFDMTGRDWWAVPSSGDYTTDCNMGRCMARELLRYMREFDDGPILGSVIRSMKKSDASAGHITGFCFQISRELLDGFDLRAQLSGQ